MKHYVFGIFFLIVSLPLASIQYSTNFMWINYSKTSDPLIFPEERPKEDGWTINVMDDWIAPWISSNKAGHFIFWYDSNTVSPKQLENTQKAIDELKISLNAKNAQIELKDINKLKFVQNNEPLIARLPMYAKLDLLRVAAGLEYLQDCQDQDCAYVYVDIDKGLQKDGEKISSLSLDEASIFNETNLAHLRNFGLIMNDQGGHFPENNFLILGNNATMKQALNDVVLQGNLDFFENWLTQRIEPLLAQVSSPELKSLPLDARWPKHPDFAKEDSRVLKSLSHEVPTGVQRVWSTMVKGPLLDRFNQLNQATTIPRIAMGGSMTFSMSGGWPNIQVK